MPSRLGNAALWLGLLVSGGWAGFNFYIGQSIAVPLVATAMMVGVLVSANW
jgi:hypothetical protein